MNDNGTVNHNDAGAKWTRRDTILVGNDRAAARSWCFPYIPKLPRPFSPLFVSSYLSRRTDFYFRERERENRLSPAHDFSCTNSSVKETESWPAAVSSAKWPDRSLRNHQISFIHVADTQIRWMMVTATASTSARREHATMIDGVLATARCSDVHACVKRRSVDVIHQ